MAQGHRFHDQMAEPQIALLSTLRNPKRDKESCRGRAAWYEYYAGFSPGFVEDALTLTGAQPGCAVILDPWNGSGTTTDVSSSRGFDSVGFDLNPVMVIVARARTLQAPRKHVLSILDTIIDIKSTYEYNADEDSLSSWLTNEATICIRQFERAIQQKLIGTRAFCAIGPAASLENVSPLAAFFYVGLFRALRKILKPFRSSNPTWVKDASGPSERIDMSRNDIASLVRSEVLQMAQDLPEEDSPNGCPRQLTLGVASSSSIPLGDGTVQLVITSPPYCTRIDYVIKTGPELALLGFRAPSAVRQLRELMIGTPTILQVTPTPIDDWGPTCLELLHRIEHHTSRASKSYYLKTFAQYFDGLYRSLTEIRRVLDDAGECFLVVQDSHYKEIRVDVAQIVTEMGHVMGLTCDVSRHFASSRAMVGLNARARVYNDPPNLPIESVLHFIKT